MQSAIVDLKAGQAREDSIYISWDEAQASGILQAGGDNLFGCREKDHWLIFNADSATGQIRTSLDRCQ